LYDRYDLWAVDLSGKRAAHCLTGGYGRKHKVVLRLLGADYGGLLNLNASILLRSFNEHTKSKGVYKLESSGDMVALADHVDHSVKVVAVSGNGQSFLFSPQSYEQYPDLWFSNNRFQQSRRLTNANPQQQQFQWGSARVFSWTNYEGKNNEGLLYLPHNFDSSKRYPVIVDFYEKHSADLHEYLTPEYSTSTINIPTYVSNGYIVFRPDIHYTVGVPGESVYNAVVSGAQALVAQGFADSTRMGVQGHSFSGFEVAYLLTRTSLFACANIGAGVVNFTYNYTFVRSNGAPGLFKFEVEQYRMGKTLWEDPQGYINNSPIFKADRITTPVVILHNDKDGAVPFTQGLDLFLAMRRLQKPAWLLNYKGQNHTLEELIPQQDWTLRMRQFFDHYLKNAPMPRWMKEGISVDERKIDPKFNY
jgi:dipeptidyl aminopeptidase/acylaminoacyl peptidase